MSRLARSCKDWHQLLELCARFRTLLADADGLYDPTDYNDRLLLGLFSPSKRRSEYSVGS
jgi:DNA invertase Pin-like site-specific DNA recombinase